MPPIEQLKDKFDSTMWDPPFLDGAELTINGLFERTGHMIKNESTGIPHRLISGKEWGQEYDVVRVQIPNFISNGHDNSSDFSDFHNIQQQQDSKIKESLHSGYKNKDKISSLQNNGKSVTSKQHGKHAKHAGEKNKSTKKLENLHLGPGEEENDLLILPP
jgi:hypothetical protein